MIAAALSAPNALDTHHQLQSVKLLRVTAAQRQSCYVPGAERCPPVLNEQLVLRCLAAIHLVDHGALDLRRARHHHAR